VNTGTEAVAKYLGNTARALTTIESPVLINPNPGAYVVRPGGLAGRKELQVQVSWTNKLIFLDLSRNFLYHT